MNVLYVSHCKGIEGGASLSLLYLMEEMKSKGVKVYILVPEKDSSSSYIYRIRGFKVISCKYDWWMKVGAQLNIVKAFFSKTKYSISTFKLALRVKKLSIDLIHTNSSVICIGALLSKFTGIPHIWHIREFGKEHYNLDFCFGERYSINLMNKYSSKIIVVSKALNDKYFQYFGKKMILVYNGISSNYIIEKRRSERKETINLLIAGTIYPGKGQETAVLAVNELIHAGFKNICLYIAGSVADYQYESKIKHMINACCISDYVKFTGYQEDLTELRQLADIELVCSHSEAFGRVTIEAMLSTNPVIGADTGGTKELIIDGYNGFLYKHSDYHDLANKIKIFIEKPEKLADMGQNALAFARENYTAEKNADQIYRIYVGLFEGEYKQ